MPKESKEEGEGARKNKREKAEREGNTEKEVLPSLACPGRERERERERVR